MRLTVVCAWCGRTEERKPGEAQADWAPRSAVNDPDLRVTHTICDRCFVHEAAQVEKIVRARRRSQSA